jgi:hypothetical protein
VDTEVEGLFHVSAEKSPLLIRLELGEELEIIKTKERIRVLPRIRC